MKLEYRKIRVIKKYKKTNYKSGVCLVCGCTENNACYISGIGACWWVNKTRTLCSHCLYNFYEKPLDEMYKNNKE